MAQVVRNQEPDNPEIVLSLLESVERDGTQSQRKLAADLGIALGLVNVYLKRCVTKGLLKISEVPTRRYAYYLTPQGFSEKSRLTFEYLSTSFSFFRRARAECSELLAGASKRGWNRVVLLGATDLAEIATLCALEAGVTIVAIVDPESDVERYLGSPVVKSMNSLGRIDAALVTDLKSAQQVAETAAEKLGAKHVLIPALLGVRLNAERADRP